MYLFLSGYHSSFKKGDEKLLLYFVRRPQLVIIIPNEFENHAFSSDEAINDRSDNILVSNLKHLNDKNVTITKHRFHNE